MSKIVIVEHIERKIYFLRGKKVMLDKDLAQLYGVAFCDTFAEIFGWFQTICFYGTGRGYAFFCLK